MALWRLVPVADKHDPRWQDRRIWHGAVVRAPTAALARIVAEQAETHHAPTHVGNETAGGSGGFRDNALYWAERMLPEEAESYGADPEGPSAVIAMGTPEEPALAVTHAPSVAGREAGKIRGRRSEGR